MTRTDRLVHAAALGCFALLAQGCASAPPPSRELDAAAAMLAEAKAAKAADFAPVEFGFAGDKLKAAQAAAADRQNDRARMAAGQALVDAELALAKSRAAQVRAELQQKTEANAQLRRELLGEEAPR